MLTGIENFLKLINDNWTTICVIIGLAVGLYQRIKVLMAKSDEEKIAIARQQISEIILHMVGKAETDYSDWNKAGSIKRSQVIAQIYAKYPILGKVVNQEALIHSLDEEIDMALKNLRNILDEEKIAHEEHAPEAETM